jgi:hypothetical protein
MWSKLVPSWEPLISMDLYSKIYLKNCLQKLWWLELRYLKCRHWVSPCDPSTKCLYIIPLGSKWPLTRDHLVNIWLYRKLHWSFCFVKLECQELRCLSSGIAWWILLKLLDLGVTYFSGGVLKITLYEVFNIYFILWRKQPVIK